jgi:hypothetical protein
MLIFAVLVSSLESDGRPDILKQIKINKLYEDKQFIQY